MIKKHFSWAIVEEEIGQKINADGRKKYSFFSKII
jgi:hypothetical protein